MAEGLRLHFRVITSILPVFMERLLGWAGKCPVTFLSQHFLGVVGLPWMSNGTTMGLDLFLPLECI
jgi:hypothetical protein